ncbi:F0F1 ATP synthase subunit gamma [Thioflexithrix psekupsensis]|uniref:ATP synthase gamma chain n=1 Tax=Thioflexithrix psekupsensis TaxID=1570016 RepID=A0A251X415_9GAMM|nr:F0F1 ATP synthase subunit gamma [Thioflexithrix psekupsensis]OUD12234.1 F0F1 ATP synthase subunit gamma [Thioflexithrix psekupsensis]
MASGKEIRTKISSIKNTQKITRAMEMVAASKMRKAQDRMQKSRPYAEKINQAIGHLAQSHPEYKHPFMQSREVRNIGVIVISSDRGLCGGLNTNMFKTLLVSMKQWQQRVGSNQKIQICSIGNKAAGFFRRYGGNVVAQRTHLGDTPTLEDLIGLIKVMLDAYSQGEIDELYLVSNQFVNTMTQRAEVKQLLPIQPSSDSSQQSHHWDYLYEPSAPEVLEMLLMRYIESLVYQGLVENIACEQAARMVAMKSASDNAGNLIGELQLAYNKARQAAITQEISEIVGGAAAV